MSLSDITSLLETHIRKDEVAFTRFEEKLAAIHDILESNSVETKELLLLLKKAQLLIGILGAVERVAVWVSKITIAIALLWATWKFVIAETIKTLSNGSSK